MINKILANKYFWHIWTLNLLGGIVWLTTIQDNSVLTAGKLIATLAWLLIVILPCLPESMIKQVDSE